MAAKPHFQNVGSVDVFGQRHKRPKMFRAGLYARVSTNDRQTLPMQSRAMREYAVMDTGAIDMNSNTAMTYAEAAERLRGRLRRAAKTASLRPDDERHPAPDFALKDADGKTVRLSDYKGKVVFPCKIDEIHEPGDQRKHKDQGFPVLGVDMDEGWDAVKPSSPTWESTTASWSATTPPPISSAASKPSRQLS